MIDLLLKAKGVDINQIDAEGQTPIFYAVSKKNLDLLILLE
jgi:ankyrin repeat protein